MRRSSSLRLGSPPSRPARVRSFLPAHSCHDNPHEHLLMLVCEPIAILAPRLAKWNSGELAWQGICFCRCRHVPARLVSCAACKAMQMGDCRYRVAGDVPPMTAHEALVIKSKKVSKDPTQGVGIITNSIPLGSHCSYTVITPKTQF